MNRLKDVQIAVIGLGYVGLPLAVEFAKKYRVVGFDINVERVGQLERADDRTLEVTRKELEESELSFTTDPNGIRSSNVYVVTTPTPINKNKQPNLGPVLDAAKTIGTVLALGDTVVFESTVYPGATEEECVPVLESVSGLKFNRDFYVGYSPERINPGDSVHRVSNIVKVTSGSTPETAKFVDDLYGSIIVAGTHRAPSIKVAEAAKVIENTQRDVNIALINELAILFSKLGLDTEDVLSAAGSKWNFLPFSPGLVGGHCIGVDPYYLTHKAQSIGYHPEIILAGRRLNDSMGNHVATEIIKRMTKKQIFNPESKVLIMGLTFKENTPDLRNTRVVDIVNELRSFNLNVDVHDPWADPEEARRLYGITLIPDLRSAEYDAVILTVAHRQYAQLSTDEVRGMLKNMSGIVYDLKYILPRESVDMRL